MKGTISGHCDSFKGGRNNCGHNLASVKHLGEQLQYPGDRHFHQTVGQLCYLISEHHGGH
ncbi:hypothetical protein T07_10371 [Trichinella nelsoni]|uniref:Uncharacterized protein n=1 Tax=Trichinella nelsoni TaxID=6336 RepID=A0A0V0S5H1_9BILA|nr:hypothetical protein T07_4457 [Trichinella nelsoni]KRX22000.1 hypothetical protein T07_10371 [Trichinella nelsoni]